MNVSSEDNPQNANALTIARLLVQIQPASILSIITALREGILVLDPELNVMTMNPAAEEIMGESHGFLSGRSVCELFGEGTCPQDILADALKSGAPIVDFQTTVRMSGGRHGHVLLRTLPLKKRDGSSLGMALILGDVTEVTTLRQAIGQRYRLGNLVGKDRKMQELFNLISDVANSEASVLIQGETGTGKELVARAIHQGSSRATGPFIQINCSALSENLLESELFGHVKGSFTGAIADRSGRFEQAEGGTIFLDEIGDVSPVVQVKLLRVLQERVIERVGDNKSIPVNVRVVSATNKDMSQLLTTGQMRKDFFYRIKVVSLLIPPLRERREDIPLLVSHLLQRFTNRENGVNPPAVTGGAMELLMSYGWPGNVRELENALEHALVLCRGGAIGSDHLPVEIKSGKLSSESTLAEVPLHSDQEKSLLKYALDAAGWNRSRAARRLGIDRTTLWRKIREYGLESDE